MARNRIKQSKNDKPPELNPDEDGGPGPEPLTGEAALVAEVVRLKADVLAWMRRATAAEAELALLNRLLTEQENAERERAFGSVGIDLNVDLVEVGVGRASVVRGGKKKT
jgi:hypothetical protein